MNHGFGFGATNPMVNNSVSLSINKESSGPKSPSGLASLSLRASPKLIEQLNNGLIQDSRFNQHPTHASMTQSHRSTANQYPEIKKKRQTLNAIMIDEGENSTSHHVTAAQKHRYKLPSVEQ